MGSELPKTHSPNPNGVPHAYLRSKERTDKNLPVKICLCPTILFRDLYVTTILLLLFQRYTTEQIPHIYLLNIITALLRFQTSVMNIRHAAVCFSF